MAQSPQDTRGDGYASSRGALILLTGYQTPVAIRGRGYSHLSAWLAKRKVRGADEITADALAAAKAQRTTEPGEDVAASIVADLAAQILATDARISNHSLSSPSVDRGRVAVGRRPPVRPGPVVSATRYAPSRRRSAQGRVDRSGERRGDDW